HSGEPYVLHPIGVAKIVVSGIGLGFKSICAALLHDIEEDSDYTIDDVRNLFGDKIASLTDGLEQIKKILDRNATAGGGPLAEDTENLQADNFKRILLMLGDDVRVVLIKLADRLHNCRNLDKLQPAKREKILAETRNIFIPLAHRLGLYAVKSELENIWLKWTSPEVYADIAGRIERDLAQRSREIDEFIAPIDEALRTAGFRFEIRKRIKTPYSIWFKMNHKHVPFEQIFDLYAVRIVFEPGTENTDAERSQAYIIYSAITKLYEDQPSRRRDWIKQPKSNGYEALHCTLMSKSGIWVEVQIRSRRMDDIAEKGIAAHWAYKNDGYLSEGDSSVDRWLARVKEVLERKDVDAPELLDIIQNDLVTSEIVVFTPKGEQRKVPAGATALDFAYSVHTKVGSHAIACKVNMKLAPLSQVLKAGDLVEIITTVKGAPRLEWLEFLKTRSARKGVYDYIRTHRPEELAEADRLMHRSRSGAAAPQRFSISVEARRTPGLEDRIRKALLEIAEIERISIDEI
ncbi:MAG: bifunctional (p)ppGpp synthetase/guanosine-3',5'-bis(diphosphate) 3'-pyrophosphohydrolase, partial [Bacteroidales bacterium]|nr:bifunctional (p)ppGpp synthetase/guanosine-3',5'-bis(diphosphate) 3'-pyrophosphohydrolase [Bacteroidales bacterium]